MKKMVLVVGLLTLVAFVAVAMAQQKTAPAPAKPATTAVAPAPAAAPAPAPEKAKAEKPKAAKVEKFSGTVEKVDATAKSVVVKDKKGEKTFMIGEKTKLTKGGKDMPFAEVKEGMHASVEYKTEGDKMMAEKMTVSAPKAAPKEKKPAEPPKK
jgi:hypothetical protein